MQGANEYVSLCVSVCDWQHKSHHFLWTIVSSCDATIKAPDQFGIITTYEQDLYIHTHVISFILI